jgi:ribosomal-protein-alanine N-acetyltransferase
VSDAILENERLIVEPVTLQHAEAMLAYHVRNRAHLEPWEPARHPNFYELAYQRGVIERSLASEIEMRFVGIERETSTIVASVNLSNIRRGVNQSAIIGYSVDEASQGRGYATACAGAVMRYAFDVLNLHRLETSYNPINVRSGKVLRNLGFVVEGYARDYLRINGNWNDAILVGRTNDAWRP